jgi:DNA-binding transcriptional ArsR family regulator
MVEDQDEHLDSLFHALANDTRREIISLLAERPHNISELAPRFDMSLAAVSKHIKTLERAGLIDRQVVGRNHVCRLHAEALGDAHTWLGAYESFWKERLDVLERVLRQSQDGSHGGKKS